MSIAELNYFVCIAEQKSLTKAAGKLFLSQSALSQYLKKTEDKLNCTLFNRNGRELELTEAGRIYYRSAIEIIGISNRTVEEIHALNDMIQKTVTIGVTGSKTLLFTSRVVEQLQAVYPKYSIRYVQDEMKNLCSQVKTHQIMCALGAINFQTGVETVSLWNQPLALYVSHYCNCIDRIDGSSPMDISRFSDQQFILLHSGTIHRQLMDQYFSAHGFSPIVFAESRDYETIYNAVNTSPVVTIASISHHGNMPDAHMVPLVCAPKYDLGIIYTEHEQVSPYLKSFIEVAIQNRETFGK